MLATRTGSNGIPTWAQSIQLKQPCRTGDIKSMARQDSRMPAVLMLLGTDLAWTVIVKHASADGGKRGPSCAFAADDMPYVSYNGSGSCYE